MLDKLQQAILFPGTGYRVADIEDGALASAGLERWWLPIDDGRVEAWFMPASEVTQPAPAVIFAHGNGELIDMWPEALRGFNRLGIHVLLVEYPGYGRSSGEPGLTSVRQSFVAAYDKLLDQASVDRGRLIGFGRSLGGGAITTLARERALAGLILASTFTSIADMARKLLIPSFVVGESFDSLSFIKTYNRPVLVVHGSEDELVPFAHGKKLAAAAPRGRLVVYNADHNDCPPDWPQFWRDVERWLRDVDLLESGQGRQ